MFLPPSPPTRSPRRRITSYNVCYTKLLRVVINPEESGEAHAKAYTLRVEYVLSVRGKVRRRPPGTENPALPTGEVEVTASSLAILNESKPLPFV